MNNTHRCRTRCASQRRGPERGSATRSACAQLGRAALSLLLVVTLNLSAAEKTDNKALPVRGFCIPAPSGNRVDEFIKFIEEELAPRSVNTLILRVDYGFQFTSHPEMADKNGLSKEQAQKIAAACKRHQIRIIPLVNLLGHQSWQSNCGKLLRVHPEFDETPAVKFPEKYAWPNPDKLYCKSYCPRHPQVHDVVFALVDEVCDAFEADAFHAGMDEVFYIGEDHFPAHWDPKLRIPRGQVVAAASIVSPKY